jgi:hypothetical protein
MKILDAEFVKGFIRMANDGWEQGWHERNGGNLTYRIKADEVDAVKENFTYDRPWTPIGTSVPDLAGEFFMTTGSGKYFRNVILDAEANTGIVEIDEKGENFRIVWGLLNCFIILASRALQPLWDLWHKRVPRISESKPWAVWQATRTFLLMGLIRSLDCYANVPKTFRLWGTMLTRWNLGELLTGGILRLGLDAADWCVIALGVAVMFAVSQFAKAEPLRYRLSKRPVLWTLAITLGVVVILIFGSYGIGYNAGDFIYTQF